LIHPLSLGRFIHWVFAKLKISARSNSLSVTFLGAWMDFARAALPG